MTYPWVKPACPNCDKVADNYPDTLDRMRGEKPAPWWCKACLRRKVVTTVLEMLESSA